MHIEGALDSRTVRVDGKVLSPGFSQRIVNHSPDGFNWGYGGSGPAQLALAILLHAANAEIARRWYQDFKWEHVAKWKGDFKADVDVDAWLKAKEQR
jgi:hypothetical protein